MFQNIDDGPNQYVSFKKPKIKARRRSENTPMN
jgi:hypothetical protein